MALGVLQPRTGQTIGVRTLVFLYSYLYALLSVQLKGGWLFKEALLLSHGLLLVLYTNAQGKVVHLTIDSSLGKIDRFLMLNLYT